MLLKDYIPLYLAKTATFTACFSTEQLEINGVNNTIQDIIDQCFVATATWGLDYWEDLLGIAMQPGKDIAFRRSTIEAKLRGSGTVSTNLIQTVASSFTNGKVVLVEHPSIYSFEVVFEGTKGIPPNLLDLQAAIERIKPAHLAVTYTFVYTQWGAATTTTWSTIKTGTWSGLLNGTVI